MKRKHSAVENAIDDTWDLVEALVNSAIRGVQVAYKYGIALICLGIAIYLLAHSRWITMETMNISYDSITIVTDAAEKSINTVIGGLSSATNAVTGGVSGVINDVGHIFGGHKAHVQIKKVSIPQVHFTNKVQNAIAPIDFHSATSIQQTCDRENTLLRELVLIFSGGTTPKLCRYICTARNVPIEGALVTTFVEPFAVCGIDQRYRVTCAVLNGVQLLVLVLALILIGAAYYILKPDLKVLWKDFILPGLRKFETGITKTMRWLEKDDDLYDSKSK